jgi:hypothetical protein
MTAGKIMEPWAFDSEESTITCEGAPVFKVMREWDFPCIEDEDRPAADMDYLAHANVAVLLLNMVATTKEPITGQALAATITSLTAEVERLREAQEARERDKWNPDPEDPFWMLEVRQGFANAGAWVKNLDSCLTTRDPSRAIRFPSRWAAECSCRRLYPLDGQFEPTEHSWISLAAIQPTDTE